MGFVFQSVETVIPFFHHGGLQNSAKQIRLLRPRKGSSEKEFDLFHCSLDSAPSYRALSYTWGLDRPTEEILINGRRFRIRRNLYDFLGEYEKKFPGDDIWIDQICIDQSDIIERNHQVHLMSDIYRGATEVLIWISPYAWNGEQVKQCSPACRLSHYNYFHKRCEWLQHIFSNRYWTRLWIVQEVVLARELSIHVGSSVLHWHEISDVIEHGGFQHKYAQSTPVQLTWLIDRFSQSHREEFSAAEVFRYCSSSMCEDPRDRVYGLQALIPEDQQVPVDYSKSTKDVFASVLANFSERGDLGSEGMSALDHLARAMGLKLDIHMLEMVGMVLDASPQNATPGLPHIINRREPPLQIPTSREWRHDDKERQDRAYKRRESRVDKLLETIEDERQQENELRDWYFDRGIADDEVRDENPDDDACMRDIDDEEEYLEDLTLDHDDRQWYIKQQEDEYRMLIEDAQQAQRAQYYRDLVRDEPDWEQGMVREMEDDAKEYLESIFP